MAASVYVSRLNLIVLKLHHSEGGVSASSDASEIQIVSSVHGVRQRLPIHGSLLWSLRGSSGLHAGHDSGFVVYPRSWIRLRPYRHGWLFRHPPMSRFFFSEDGPPVVKLSRNSCQLREVSACFLHQKTFLPRSPIGLWQFPGLSSPETSQQASLYWLPVSIMCGSTCDSSLELMRMRAFLRYQGVTRSAVFEPDGSWSSALGGAPFHLCYASVFMGRNTMLGIFSSVSIQFWIRLDTETASVSAASEKVAGVNRPVRNLTTSPLLPLLGSVPQSQCSWDGASSPTMRWVAGVCFSSICAGSCGSLIAPLVLLGPPDDHSSLLAPEALVSGVSGVGSRRADGSASGQGSIVPASCSSTATGSVNAGSSCLVTIRLL